MIKIGIGLDLTVNPVNKAIGQNLQVDTVIRNNLGSVATYFIGVSIGKDGVGWHDIDIYNDGKGDYASVTLAPGQTSSAISRSMTIPNDPSLQSPWDVWVTIKDPSTLQTIDSVIAYNVIILSTSPPPSGKGKAHFFMMDKFTEVPVANAEIEEKDGKFEKIYTDAKGIAEVFLNPGDYTTYTRHPSYNTRQSKFIIVKDQTTNITESLDPKIGNIIVDCYLRDKNHPPVGGWLYGTVEVLETGEIDTAEDIFKAAEFILKEGNFHTFRCRSEGYQTEDFIKEIKPDQWGGDTQLLTFYLTKQ